MKIISDIKCKNVLVSPLDWGLGHSSRMIPVIEELKKHQNRVTVVCGFGSYDFLQAELPDTEIIKIKEKRIKYPQGKINFFTFLNWIFVMIFNTINEKLKIKKIIREKNIEVVISDNRYGLNFKGLECYIVTHQICPRLPERMKIFQRISDFVFKTVLKRFKKVLIPDLETGFSLTGKLGAESSDGKKFVKIGILSRFSSEKKTEITKKYDYLILISGQEKQRTVFENFLLKKISNTAKKILFIRGVFSSQVTELKDFNNVKFLNNLTGEDLKQAFLEAETVICRAGYSTICDIMALNKKAVIFPTPGQTEQEFLAQRLNKKYGFVFGDNSLSF